MQHCAQDKAVPHRYKYIYNVLEYSSIWSSSQSNIYIYMSAAPIQCHDGIRDWRTSLCITYTAVNCKYITWMQKRPSVIPRLGGLPECKHKKQLSDPAARVDLRVGAYGNELFTPFPWTFQWSIYAYLYSTLYLCERWVHKLHGTSTGLHCSSDDLLSTVQFRRI